MLSRSFWTALGSVPYGDVCWDVCVGMYVCFRAFQGVVSDSVCVFAQQYDHEFVIFLSIVVCQP